MRPGPVPPEDGAGFELSCAHEGTRRALSAWLEETGLAWPGVFRLNVMVADECPFPPDGRASHHQVSVSIIAGPPAGTARVEWSVAPAVAIVDPTRPDADLWLSPAAVAHLASAQRSFLLVVLVFLLRRLGWYHVHGAALIDPRGRGWLIAGDSHCGKSTTTALLAANGWSVGTDDIGFLAQRDESVVALGARSLIALRPGGLALLGAAGGAPLTQRNKEGFWPEELGGAWAPVVTPRIIAFPTIGERTAVERATPREALSAVVRWSHWVMYEPVFAQPHLDVLGRLAGQARCFNLTLGPDLFDRPALLEELVS